MANGSSPEDNIDGVNQWPHFSQNKSGIRSEILYGIGEKGEIGYRHNEMKLMVQASFCQKGNIKGEAKMYTIVLESISLSKTSRPEDLGIPEVQCASASTVF